MAMRLWQRCAWAAVGSAWLAAAAVACTSGDAQPRPDPDAGRSFDPARAEELAHALLPLPTDLPGIGWETVSEDEFDDGQPPVQTPACTRVEARRAEIRARTDPARLARAEREVQRGQADHLPATVEIVAVIFNRNDAPSEGLALFAKVATGADFEQCLEDRINRNLGPASPARVETRRAKALATVPGEGVALAFDFRMTAEGEIADLRYESYVWRFANAQVTVTFSGPLDEVTGSFIRAVLERVQARASGAAS